MPESLTITELFQSFFGMGFWFSRGVIHVTVES